VAAQHRGAYLLLFEGDEVQADVSGRHRHGAGDGGLPAVGDWVAARAPDGDGRATIAALLSRRTAFSRTAAGGETREQVVAANVDTVFVVTALGGDLNARRLERYLTAAWESGADPVVVVTKTDLVDDLTPEMTVVNSIALGVPVQAVSSLTGDGVDELRRWVSGSQTVALLGSSGVGKSTLVNRLIGEDVQAVSDLRDDGRGRHTTTHRQLFVVPEGGLVLDTPGMRELALWDAGDGLSSAFAEVEETAASCRFGDCTHRGEPGCAIRAALAEGSLEPERVASYEKLQRELAFLARKQDKRAAADEKRRWKAISREQRARTTVKRKGR
jgi:ribosome biogenesis GTPase